ncbi:putative phosphoribosylanthranilate transferase [Arabidopsis thaliana]|nr:F6N23.8 gene product [Arabidopsis thaliana]CAB80879.1 putative phosphoribosylanthranilate transferase [Arabidopsis thaliana]
MSNIKLGVEVISAQGLLQRDKHNSCSPFVELKFDNQIFRATTKHNDPNPVWHECFYFVVSDPSVLSTQRPTSGTYDLVEEMKFLYVRVVKARDLPNKDLTGSLDPYVVVKIGNFKGVTTHFNKNTDPEWNQVFAFAKDNLQSNFLEVMVKDKDILLDDFVGIVKFDLREVQSRVPPDSPLAPQWYRLENKRGEKKNYEIMLADVIIVSDKSRVPEVFVRVKVGNQMLRTKFPQRSNNPKWGDEFTFVVAEPFEDNLVLSVEDHTAPNRDEPVGKAVILMNDIEKRKGTSDTYVVAKYGHKWVRSRTVINSMNPKYNEQYTWEVFDPATVLTICVFDNAHFAAGDGGNKRDQPIGKVRIRLSTLQTGRVYTHAYPLLVLQPTGLKKRGELHLAVRFTCTSVSSMLMKYTKPLLPKMHYILPLSTNQQEALKMQAINIIIVRLGRSEPPLRREVVDYLTDWKSQLFSMRRSKANFNRFTTVFSGALSVWKWMEQVCTWKTPVTTALVHVLYTMLVTFPEMILPTVFLYMAVIGMWNYRFKPRFPPHMDAKLSYADNVNSDELDEEFDTFPTVRAPDIVKMRYDRLRSVAGKVQSVAGDIAAQGERVQALLSWRDPRATAIFVTFCFIIAMALYITPFKLVALLSGYYFMRHPKLRHRIPSAPVNFFRRLPAMTDSML